MTKNDLTEQLQALFEAEQSVRKATISLLDEEPSDLLPVLTLALDEALQLSDEEEQALRLVRLAELFSELDGPDAIDRLMDILGSDEPEARHAAGTALEEIGYERFKDLALGVERALDRLDASSPALVELPYLLSEITDEPGVVKLLARFAAHSEPNVVAAAIEAIAETGDPAARKLLAPLRSDRRVAQLDEDGDEVSPVSLGELARDAYDVLGAAEEIKGRRN